MPRLIAAIDGVFQAAAKADLTLDYRAIPLAQVEATWKDQGQRIVFLPN